MVCGLVAVALAVSVASFAGVHSAPDEQWQAMMELGMFPPFVPSAEVPLLSNETPPEVPPQWSAEIVSDANFVGIESKGGRGKFWYDRPGMRTRETYSAHTPYFDPNVVQYKDNVETAEWSNSTMGRGADGACFPFKTKYQDQFAWLKSAQHAGQKVVQGVSCSVWTARSSSGDVMQACITADGFPREMNTSSGIPGTKFFDTKYTVFSNHSVGGLDTATFEQTEACSRNYPMKPCRDKRVIAMDTYRIWGLPEPLELGNKDTGDVMGDLSFVCTQGSGAAYRSKLITYWRVNVSTAFGQYAICNFDGTDNVCMGPPEQQKTVGKRSGQMAGRAPWMGQCSSNDDVGSQYSFPRAAQCPHGVVPTGAGGCAWGGAVPLRTVKASCVMEDRGLLDACRRDVGKAPFKEAMAVWNRAFASTDPSMGGCPEVPTVPTEDVAVLV